MKSRKYIILVFALLVVPAEMTAQNRIDKNQAVTVSTNFLRSIGLSTGQLLNVEDDYLNDTLCLYCVHYSNGNWTIVSASEYERPVLAYGNGTDMTLQYSDNPGFNALIWKYKRNILNADISVSRGLMPADSTTLRDIEERWQKLLYNAKGINSVEIKYNPGASLLNIPGRGDVKWGQTYNNENGCIPSYNRFCRGELLLNCDCGRTCAGCGPVALGQVMWYWQWPLYSPEDSEEYVWKEMPSILLNSTDTNKGNMVAKLLKDLGSSMNALYNCPATAVLPGNIVDGFADFGYRAVERKKRRDWRYGYSWTELIRTEIDCNRPVVLYGEENLIFSGHYFVVDGYAPNDNNYFNINWGWRGAYNGFYYLYDHDFTDDMSAYIGISPTYNSSEIVQYYHDGHSVTSYLFAAGNLTLPDLSLPTIESGQNIIINAGQSVALSPGFEAPSGSEVCIEIDKNFLSSLNIVILEFPDFSNIHESGALMKVINANSFECSIYRNGNNDPIYQHSGIISDNNALLWNGAEYDPTQVYRFDVTFRNNFGEKYHLIFYNTQGESSPNPSQLSNNEDVHFVSDDHILLMPNPAKEYVTVTSSFQINHVELFSLNGKKLLHDKIDGMTTTLNTGNFPSGKYILRIVTNEGTAYKKLIIQ